jgi:hypothetical protein
MQHTGTCCTEEKDLKDYLEIILKVTTTYLEKTKCMTRAMKTYLAANLKLLHSP